VLFGALLGLACRIFWSSTIGVSGISIWIEVLGIGAGGAWIAVRDGASDFFCVFTLVVRYNYGKYTLYTSILTFVLLLPNLVVDPNAKLTWGCCLVPQGQLETMGLNKAQAEAVSTPQNSVLQILAGPGSGKTKVLTHRVCFLLQQGVLPENIILTTFTNVFPHQRNIANDRKRHGR
jgi:hypothetical protein